MAENELLIDFNENGIAINSNDKCSINLDQKQEKLEVLSTKEISIVSSETSSCTLNKDGITLKVGSDVSIQLTSSGITLSAGQTKLELQSNTAELSSTQATIKGDSLLNLNSNTSVQIG